MGLNSYKRKDDQDGAVWVSIEHGVKVLLREMGTPEYQRQLLKLSEIVTEEELKEASVAERIKDGQHKVELLLGEYLILAIDDEGEVIDSRDEITAIVTDPTMWEFKEKVLEAAREKQNFMLHKKVAAVGNSEDSPEGSRTGGSNTLKKAKSGQTSPSSLNGAETSESRLPA